MATPPRQIRTVYDNSEKVIAAIKRLGETQVLAGVPADQGPRGTTGISNAALAYIHEHGEPAHNIPARAFLVPGVRAVSGRIAEQLKRAGVFAIKGDEASMMQQLHAAGIIASQSAKNMITQGLAPPLRPATIRARLRKTARGQKMLRTIRKAGANVAAWGAANMKPLYDTGQLLRAISYVIRRKGHEDTKAQ